MPHAHRYTWREIAKIWANNRKDTNNEWIPVGSNDLANALLEAKDEIAQLEMALRAAKQMDQEGEYGIDWDIIEALEQTSKQY